MVQLTSALTGLHTAQAQFNAAASKISRAPVTSGPGSDSVDLSAAAVALLQSRNNFEANTKLVKAADEMERALIDIAG
jgi:flagellar hook protein FlgE